MKKNIENLITIEHLWAENIDSTHELAMLLLKAFEEKNRDNNLSRLEELFNKYFVSNHRMYNFFEQVDIELINSLDPLQKLEFHKLINQLLVEYTNKTHTNQTLLDILELAIISKATNINPIILTIWRTVEQSTQSSRDSEDKAFRIEVFRSILSLPPMKVCNRIINRMLSNVDSMEVEYMPIILLRRAIEDISTLPRLLKIFTSHKWEKHISQKQTAGIIAELIVEIGVYDIVSVLNELSVETFWFIDALNTVKGIDFRFNEKQEKWRIVDYKLIEYPIAYNYQLYQKLTELELIKEEENWQIVDHKPIEHPVAYNYQHYQKLTEIKLIKDEQEQITSPQTVNAKDLEIIVNLLESNNSGNLSNKYNHPQTLALGGV